MDDVPEAHAKNDQRSNATPPKMLRRLLQPVDIAGLVVFRIAFGLAVAAFAFKQLTGGALDYHYARPKFHFSYWGFEWVAPLPGAGMPILFAVLLFAACCVALGLFYRLSIAVTFLTFTYVFLLEQTLYNNHYYLIVLLSLLMIFMPLDRAFSIDVLRRPSLALATAPLWVLWLLRFQLGIVYFYGGIAKLNPDWLHGQPMRMWLELKSSYPLIGQHFTEDWCVQLFVWGGTLLDLFAVPLLLWRPTRSWMFTVTVLFHIMNATLFHIGIFPWLMIVATTVFFPPSWPRRLLRMPQLVTLSQNVSVEATWTYQRRLAVSLLGAYVLFQTAIPLRHYFYPGDASWTEEGHHFSWRMMLREKQSGIRFIGRTADGSHEGVIDIRPYLNERQAAVMCRNPEFIRQFAHWLADESRRRLGQEVEIRARVLVSLNGRKPQLLIDPRVDLVKQQREWRPYDWILPLVEPLRDEKWDLPLSLWEQEIDITRIPGEDGHASVVSR